MYSVIADTLHIPMAHILCWEVNPSFINELLAQGLTLSVLTGVAALSRSIDVTKLLQAVQVLAQILPIINETPMVDPEKVLSMVFTGFGINTADIYRTEEQLKALQEQQQPIGPGATPELANVAETIQQTGL